MSDKYRESTTYTIETRRFSQYLYGRRLENRVDGKIESAFTLSKKLDVHLSDIEQQRRMPLLSTVVKICRYYGISIDRFFRLGKFKGYAGLFVKSLEELRGIDPFPGNKRTKITEEAKKFLMSLRDKRLATGKSIKDLSPLVGISRSALSLIERGAQMPKEKDLKSLCDFYHIEVPNFPEGI